MQNSTNQDVSLNEKKKSKTKTILTIVLNVIFYLIILVLLLWSIMNINAGSSNGGFPNIFGYGFLSVQSDSMTRPSEFTGPSDSLKNEYNNYTVGSFSKGDLLKVKVFKESDYNNLKVGDVVTFYDDSLKALNSHRIVEVKYIDDNDKSKGLSLVTVQGDYSVWLKGSYVEADTAEKQTLYGSGDVAYLQASQIKGVAYDVVYGAGKVVDNLHQNWLFYFVIPVAVLLLVEIFVVIKNFMELKGTKQKESLATDKELMMKELEAEREKMRQELLREIKGEEVKQDEPLNKTSDEVKVEEKTEEVKEEVVESSVVVDVEKEQDTKEVETPQALDNKVEDTKEFDTPDDIDGEVSLSDEVNKAAEVILEEKETPKKTSSATKKPSTTKSTTKKTTSKTGDATSKKTTAAKKSTTKSDIAKKSSTTKSSTTKKPSSTTKKSTTSKASTTKKTSSSKKETTE